jgi:hypothetical protein
MKLSFDYLSDDLVYRYEAPASASIPTANLMQTGQTTSYRTGDDPSRGRTVDFLTLSQNNPFGNTNRFTDMNGLQVYANNIVIDWSTLGSNNTVLLYYKGDSLSYRNWNAQIDQHLSSTLGGLTGWYLWNIKEALNLVNLSTIPYRINYPPFNFVGSQRYFLTNSDYGNGNVFACDMAGAVFLETGKGNALLGVWVRYTTLAELGL